MFTISSEQLERLQSMIGRVVMANGWVCEYNFSSGQKPDYKYTMTPNGPRWTAVGMVEVPVTYKEDIRSYNGRKAILKSVDSNGIVTAHLLENWRKNTFRESVATHRTDFLEVSNRNRSDHTSHFRLSCIIDLVFPADETRGEERIVIQDPHPRYQLVPAEITERVKNSVRAPTEIKDDDY